MIGGDNNDQCHKLQKQEQEEVSKPAKKPENAPHRSVAQKRIEMREKNVIANEVQAEYGSGTKGAAIQLANACKSSHQKLEGTRVFEGNSRTLHDGAKRIVGDVNRKFGFFAEANVQATQQCTTT